MDSRGGIIVEDAYPVYRTSRLVLTAIGRMLLVLGPRDQERKREKLQARARQQAEKKEKAKRELLEAPVHKEQEHIQGHGDDGGGRSELQPDTVGMTNEVGLY